MFAEPSNDEAKGLLAEAYDQLGYQAQSGPWRDVYLTGAFELRHGGPDVGVNLATAIDMLKHAPMERFLDAIAARLNPEKAAGKEMTVNLVFTDVGSSYVFELKNSVLRHYTRDPDPDADVTLKITRGLYFQMLAGEAGLKDTLLGDELEVDGSRLALIAFFRLMDTPDGKFNIVVP